MGGQDAHQHQFRVGDGCYGPRGTDLDLIPEDGVRLDQIIATADPGTQTVLDYLYDFGDDREHRVSVETVTAADPGLSLPAPHRRAKRLHAWAEDCGGASGYRRLRDMLADPPTPEREELLERLGPPSPADFDPARFDAHDVDTRLAAITSATHLR